MPKKKINAKIDELKAQLEDINEKIENIDMTDVNEIQAKIDDVDTEIHYANNSLRQNSQEKGSILAKLDELKLNSVFTIDNSDNKIAQTVIKNSTNKNCNILSLDSMQSTTWSEIQDGKNYLSVMSENLSKIKEGLK